MLLGRERERRRKRHRFPRERRERERDSSKRKGRPRRRRRSRLKGNITFHHSYLPLSLSLSHTHTRTHTVAMTATTIHLSVASFVVSSLSGRHPFSTPKKEIKVTAAACFAAVSRSAKRSDTHTHRSTSNFIHSSSSDTTQKRQMSQKKVF